MQIQTNPNTSPDSPLNGESGEVFGVVLHLFVTKFLGSWVINQHWHICGIICLQKVGAFWHQMHSEGGCIWCFMQQRVKIIPRKLWCHFPRWEDPMVRTYSVRWLRCRRLSINQLINQLKEQALPPPILLCQSLTYRSPLPGPEKSIRHCRT